MVPAAVGGGGFSVRRCTDPTTNAIVAGSYLPSGSNHGRPVYKKTQQVRGFDVLAYFWDERDGVQMSGWWFGPAVGADNVWAYNADRKGLKPPQAGWQVPFGGPVDPLLVLVYSQPAAAPLLTPRAASVVAPPAMKRPGGAVTGPPGQPAAKVLRPAGAAAAAGGHRGIMRIRSVAGKLQSATPENWAALEEELKIALFEELPSCGSVEQQAELNSEVTAVAERSRKLVFARQQAAEASRLAARLTIECDLRDADSRAWLLRRLGRLEAAYGVKAEVGRESVRLRPAVGTRLSDEAVDEVEAVAKADAYEAAEGVGSNEVEAKVELEPDADDAAVALSSMEFQYGVCVRALPPQAQVPAGGARDLFETLVRRVKELQRNEPSAKQKWVDLCEAAGKSKHDPAAYDVSFLQRFLRELEGEGGVPAAGEDAAAPEVVPLRVIGPRDAARDAAALLWARYVLGQKTAGVLQAPGQVQGMSSMMAGDFKGDLAALESEHSVEVHQADTLLWIAGKNAQNVTTAKRLLQEMLEFYMPEGFHLRKGLSKEEVEALCRDPGMICRTSADPEGGAPACGAALDARAGTAWLCASTPSGLAEAKQHLDHALRAAREAAARPAPAA